MNLESLGCVEAQQASAAILKLQHPVNDRQRSTAVFQRLMRDGMPGDGAGGAGDVVGLAELTLQDPPHAVQALQLDPPYGVARFGQVIPQRAVHRETRTSGGLPAQLGGDGAVGEPQRATSEGFSVFFALCVGADHCHR
jgi:hypothetical protein